MAIKRILVPIDFSQSSLHALEYAVQLAKPFKSELRVLYVLEPIYYAAPEIAGGTVAFGALIDAQRDSATAQLARIERRYAQRGVKLRTLLLTGVAHHAIVETANQSKTDLIVMSTHGRTGVAHLLIGSVTERVVRTATCPVLTIHTPTGKVRAVPRRRSAAAGARRKAT